MEFATPHINLSTIEFTPELLRCIPAAIARKYRVMPVLNSPDCLTIVLSDFDLNVIDNLMFYLNRELQIWHADVRELDAFIERFYSDGSR